MAVGALTTEAVLSHGALLSSPFLVLLAFSLKPGDRGGRAQRERAQRWWPCLPPENDPRIPVVWSLRPGLGRVPLLGNSKGTSGTQKRWVSVAPTRCLVSMLATCVHTRWLWETVAKKDIHEAACALRPSKFGGGNFGGIWPCGCQLNIFTKSPVEKPDEIALFL